MAGAVNRFILYSDIAGSSRLADAYPREYTACLDRHNALVLEVVTQHGGLVYKNLGDGYIALFETARACADCAVMLQCALGELPPLNPSGAGVPAGQSPSSASLPFASGEGPGEENVGRAAVPAATIERLLVRLALHGGELRQSDGEYFGPALNRASRICQVISGGQVVASGAVISLLGGAGASPANPATGEGARATAPTITDLGEHHLRDLAEPEHLYQFDHPGFALHEFPPLATLNNRPNNLVEQPNRFIGRVKELAELEGLLVGASPFGGAGVPAGQTPPRSAALPATGEGARATEGVRATGTTRLLTIIAPGGYGKSRIAAQLCANLLPQFERGCFMVYLAPVRDVIDVPMAIGSALGYQFSAGRTPEQQLCDYLRSKELLLCLDNLEHVLERAPLVADILKAAPKVKIVITSREPLRIKGEQTYQLEPLGVEATGEAYGDAEKLFADRARLVRHDLALDADNAALVRDICGALSGIPLAIELAAAWMDGFTLAELRAELDQQLELESRESDTDDRHRSLKASLDWSWNLLGEQQQEMLMRLSVFRGGFFADAASAVLNEQGMTLRSALLKLCDKSWLYTREVDAQTRFLLRDMLAHEYAFAKLEATQESSTAWAQAPVPAHEGRQAGAPAATRQTSGAAPESSLYESAVCAHAAYFAALAGREGPRLSGGGTPDGGKAQMQALHTWRLELANIEEALDSALKRGKVDWLLPIAEHLQRCYDLSSSFLAMFDRYSNLHAKAEALGNPVLIGLAQRCLGSALWRVGNNRDAAELLQRVLSLAQQGGDRALEAGVLRALATVCLSSGETSKGMELAELALGVRREVGGRSGEAHALGALASGHRAYGNSVRAAELFAEALTIYRDIGDRNGAAGAAINVGTCFGQQGDYARAAELFNQGLATCRDIGNRDWEANALDNLGLVSSRQGDYVRAADLHAQSLAIRREIGDSLGEASSQAQLGGVHLLLGHHALAALLQRESLTIFREIGHKTGVCVCSSEAAAVLISLRALRQAAVALACGLTQAAAINYHFELGEQKQIDDTRASLDAAVAAGEITAEQLAAWQAEGEAMSLDELAEFVQAALAEVAASLPHPSVH